jgi:UDP-N-acetyl-D-galactosamine dehydrogenase
MIGNGQPVKGADVVVLGMTFKENCPDLRNSKVIDIIRELRTYGVNVHVHDPIADSMECEHEYGVALTPWEQLPQTQAVVAAVAHREYLDRGLQELTERLVPGGAFVDVKSSFKAAEVAALGLRGWRL